MKPGYKTTEFWMTLGSSVVSLVAVLLGLSSSVTADTQNALNGAIASVVGLITQAVVVYRYTMSRELAKLAAIPDPSTPPPLPESK